MLAQRSVLLAVVCLLAVLAACDGNETGPVPAIRQGVAPSSDGVEIRYAVGGHGPAVVLVHCWGGHSGFYRETVDDLARDHTVLVLDLAGHGRSGRERTDYTMTAFADDVMTAMDAADMPRAILVGHSMGGSVCIEAARLHPERVAGIVGIDNLHQVVYDFSQAEMDAYMAPMRMNFRPAVTAQVRTMFPADADTAAIARATKSMAGMPPEIAVSAFENLFAYDLAGGARALDIPLHLVNDDARPVDVEQWREHGVEVTVTPMTAVGHFPMFTAPEAFRAKLREALEAVEGK